MKKLVVLLDVLLRKMFGAKTFLNMGGLKLMASVSFDHGQEINLVFFENVDGYPVLMVNMPDFSDGSDCWILLRELLEWYCGSMPAPIVYKNDEFRGHKFKGWKPKWFYPIYVYLWNNKGWSKYSLNKLILKGEIDK